jgi:hypothetical protein
VGCADLNLQDLDHMGRENDLEGSRRDR